MTSPVSSRGALAALTVLAGLAAAAPAQAEWRGSAVATAHTPQCTAAGNPITGGIFNARLRLPNILGNPNETRLTFFDKYWSFGIRRSGALSSSFATATGFGIGSTGGIWTPNPQVRRLSLSPSSVTASTLFINMIVQINNFDWTPNCMVTFNVTLNKRP
jgi:hypothetical protein